MRFCTIITSLIIMSYSLEAQVLPMIEIDGPIKIGNEPNINPDSGMIRWNITTKDFEGYDGNSWLSLTKGSALPFPGTTLLTDKEQTILSGWIGFGDITWSKCYTKSTDPQTSGAFHAQCDYKGPTLLIIKLTNGRVLGGFSTESWKSSNTYVGQDYSFLFSIDNLKKYPISTFSNSIYDSYNYGPTFGGGHDLYMNTDMNLSYVNFPYSYQRNGLSGSVSDAACQEIAGLNRSTFAVAVEVEVWIQN